MSIDEREPSNSLTSLSLLVRIRQCSQEAWTELVDLYAPLIANWCRGRGLREADTADVMQNVFLSVAKSLDRFHHQDDQAGSFRSWLWLITRRRIADWYRSRGAWPSVGGSSNLRQCLEEVVDDEWMYSLPSDFDEEPTLNTDLDQLKLRALKQIESKVAPQTWQAFWRCVIDGQSTESVALELGLSIASVRQARSRILRRMREQLGDC